MELGVVTTFKSSQENQKWANKNFLEIELYISFNFGEVISTPEHNKFIVDTTSSKLIIFLVTFN